MTDNRNRDRRQVVPQWLPDIPLEGSFSLQNLLAEMKARLEELYVDPTPPAQPTGVIVTPNNLGNKISWNIAANAARYQAFRNITGDITTATLLRELPGNNNVSFFDSDDQTSFTRYYWIRGVSAKGEWGPFSAMAQGTNFSAAITGTAVGVDAISPGPSGTSVGRHADSGTGSNNTVVGVDSSIAAGLSNSTIVGQGTAITVGGSQTMIGQGVTGSGLRGTGLGHGVSVTATDGAAVGDSASVTGANGTAIGSATSTGSGVGNTVVGTSATSATGNNANNTVVGAQASSTGGTSVVIGQGSSSDSGNTVAIGRDSVVAGTATVLVGAGTRSGSGIRNTVIGSESTSASGNTSNNTVIGRAATGNGGDNTVIGESSAASGARSIIVGRANTVTNTDCIVIGNSLTSTADTQILIGGGGARIYLIPTGVVPAGFTGVGIVAGHNSAIALGSGNSYVACVSADVNGSVMSMNVFGGDTCAIAANITGSGTYLPLKVATNGAYQWVFAVDGGFYSVGATGDSAGDGTINVSGNIYKNDSVYNNPDAVLEHWTTGEIVKFSDRPWAHAYRFHSLREVEDFAKEHFYLPQLDYFGIHDKPAGIFDRADASLLLHEETFRHLCELNERVKKLEDHGAPET